MSTATDTDPSLLDAQTVVEAMQADAERGLSSQEAARRLTESGPNELAETERVPTWRKLVDQLRDPLTSSRRRTSVAPSTSAPAVRCRSVPVDLRPRLVELPSAAEWSGAPAP